MGRLPRVERRRGAGAALITIFSTFFGFFDALEIEWRFEMLTFFLFWRLGDWEILQIFTFSYFWTLLWDWDFDQLAVTDVDGIRTSGTTVKSWKTSSSQSLNGRTGNNANCCINSSTGISTILSKAFCPAFETQFQQTFQMFAHNVRPSSAKKRFLFSAAVEEMRRWLVMATWAASGMR